MTDDDDHIQTSFDEEGSVTVGREYDDSIIPFEIIEEGDRAEIAWKSPHSDEEQEATGEVSDLGVFTDRYAYDDGTPYVTIDADDEDRDYRVNPFAGDEVESITYDTVATGNARRIGDLTHFEVIHT